MSTTLLKTPPAPKWLLVDAENQILGRLATQIAMILRGKHKPTFTPHVMSGDTVVVINAEKVRVTGDKLNQKLYRTHSGYMGHLKETPLKDMLKKHPEKVLTEAVSGMLPKNRTRKSLMKRLKVVVGPNHEHQAQMPELIKLT